MVTFDDGAARDGTAGRPEAGQPSSEAKHRPGYKTTEFWFTVAAMVVSSLYASGAVDAGTPVDQMLGLLGNILAAMGYQISRGLAKR